MKVCKIESNGSVKATNWKDSHNGCNGSFGLFQIGCLHGVSRENLFNPIVNIEVAYKVYKEQGWNAWYNTMKKI